MNQDHIPALGFIDSRLNGYIGLGSIQGNIPGYTKDSKGHQQHDYNRESLHLTSILFGYGAVYVTAPYYLVFLLHQ
jgi:hypothetical protein